MDILHPLAGFYWSKVCSLSWPHHGFVQCVLVNNKLYVLAENCTKLYVCSHIEQQNLWKSFDVPAAGSALGRYCSQVVLAGGEVIPFDFTDKVWASTDGINWELSLPHLSEKRSLSCLANTGSPEYLVVIGGYGLENVHHWIDKVEVLIGDQWLSIQPLPIGKYCDVCKGSLVHNGYLYLSVGLSSCTDGAIFYCKVESLVEHAKAALGGISQLNSRNLWQELPLPHHGHAPCLAAHKDKLLIFQTCPSCQYASAPAYAYISREKSWVNVGMLLKNVHSIYAAAAILPTGELAVVSHIGHGDTTPELMMASTRALPYNPENCFDISALHRLEAVGIPVVTLLARNITHLFRASGVAPDAFNLQELTAEHCVEVMIQRWQRPLTWRSLFVVLSELGQEDSCQQIEKYLTSVSPVLTLKEQCMSLIMSTLLQWRELEPDELQVKLPHYVTARDKRSIIHHFTHAITP